ncbi:MAG TPA: hybrid sensor histidine kinase/response regulator, partial [Thermoanaerobaculia bacterium]|nr:hybrid sensor histidine kinase/response regulator [Thermoanaerobaculia bacterium]
AALAPGDPLWLTGRAAVEERLGAGAAPGLEAVAFLPLAAGGSGCGTLALGFRAARVFSLAERALAEDVARQVAIAVDRARLFHRAETARMEAERASRAKDEFLAMLGHELRNPLAPIVTALHLIKLRDDGRLERERAVLDRQVAHLHRLVEDLLDVSRITHGKLQLERRPIELARAVAQALETMAPLFEQRGHRLSVEVPHAGLVVEGDPGRLAQVIGNLLANAAKFTPPGGEVAVTAESAGDEVVLAIRDSGIGMAPELAATVFDTFVQGGRPAEARGGLGLGLAIVRGLVESHGGSVAAASDGLGRGCTMTVRLPRAAGRHEHLELVRGPAPAVPAAAGVSVLIVDDNVDAAEALGELVRLLGCDCRLAYDGPSALLAAEDERPDLVLLDLGLPVMSGHEVAGHLRALSGGDDLRIVAVTGFGQSADRERSRLSGCDDHWVKPLDPAALTALIDELSRSREEVAASA